MSNIIILYFTILYFIILYFIILYFIIFYIIILIYILLYYIILYYIILLLFYFVILFLYIYIPFILSFYIMLYITFLYCIYRTYVHTYMDLQICITLPFIMNYPLCFESASLGFCRFNPVNPVNGGNIPEVNLSTSLHRLAKLSVMTPHSDRMLRQAVVLVVGFLLPKKTKLLRKSGKKLFTLEKQNKQMFCCLINQGHGMDTEC